ncbi:hypothetical protein AMK24_26350 [Streptomyces sp. CB02366]|nr:hypothetical protein AMK24_26350 [Streptomyces sp. CB02366]
MVDLAAAVGVPAEQEPFVRQCLERVGHRVLGEHSCFLLRLAVEERRIDDWCSGLQLAHLKVLRQPLAELPPPP